jgi:hypothetical protein
MNAGCKLLWILFVSSVCFGSGANSADLHFRSCLKQALRKNSPPERDNARSFCLEKFGSVSLSTCSNEATKMEYRSNSEEALKNCYYARPQEWSARSCLNVAKKLLTMLDRDNMRLDCFSQLESQDNNTKNCTMISESFEQPEYEKRYKQVCLD